MKTTGEVDPAGPRRTPAASLADAVARLTEATSLDQIAAVVRATARRLVGSDGIALVLRDGDDCHYVEEDAVSPLWKGGRFPMTSCISGWAMIHGRTAVVPDILKDQRIPQELYRRTFVRSLVMAPIGPDKPTGALGAYWAQTYQPTAEEVETVEALAAAVGRALERTALGDAGAGGRSVQGASSGPAVRAAWRRPHLRLILHRQLPFWPGQFLALSAVALSLLVRGALSPVLGTAALFTSFFPAVLVSALCGGARAAT